MGILWDFHIFPAESRALQMNFIIITFQKTAQVHLNYINELFFI